MHRHGTNQEFFTAKKQARRFLAPGLFHVKQFFILSQEVTSPWQLRRWTLILSFLYLRYEAL